MNTVTHVLVASAALARRGQPQRNTALLIGALLPDFSMMVFYAWTKLWLRLPEHEIWDTVYWQQPWQVLSAIGNSIPLMLSVLLAGFVLRARPVGCVLMAIAAAMLLHVALDMPVHAEDAHRHLWPLTDWRFHSPFSYWDSNFHAGAVQAVEWMLILGSAALLWGRFPQPWIRAVVLLAGLSTPLVGVYFVLAFGGL